MVPIDILLLSAGGLSSLIILTFSIIKRNKKQKDPTEELDNSNNQNLEKLFTEYKEHQFIRKEEFTAVYKATKKNGETVKLKIPHKIDRKSFTKESKKWQNLNHANIIKVLDSNINPIPYFETEFIEGKTLNELTKPITNEEASIIILKIINAIEYAFNEGISHQNIKPNNILIDTKNEPKITDWGLSKISEMTPSTLLYSAPEQLEETIKKDTTKIDIYQIGLILYELITGELPFKNEKRNELHLKILNEPAKKPSSIIPETQIFDDIILRCLKKDPESRPNIIELRDEIFTTIKSDIERKIKLEKRNLK